MLEMATETLAVALNGVRGHLVSLQDAVEESQWTIGGYQRAMQHINAAAVHPNVRHR